MPGNGKRFAVGGRDGADQSDFAGYQRQRGEQRHRLKAVEKVGRGFCVNKEAIGDKDKIENSLFRLGRNAACEVKADAGVCLRGLMTPCGHISHRAMDHGAKMHFPVFHHIPD